MMGFRKTIGLTIVLALSLAVAATLFQPGVSANKLGEAIAGWWQFDEGSGSVASDASSNGNDGVLSGGVAFTSDGLLGGAVEFTADSGIILVPHDVSLEPETGTFQAWVRVAALQDADVVSKITNLTVRTGVSGGFGVYGLRIRTNGGVIAFILNDDPTIPSFFTAVFTSTGLIQPDTWHHLAFRWDGAMLGLFVDGVLQVETAYDPVPGLGLSYNASSNFRLGAATSGTGGGELIGELDDVRLYGRARTDVEIFTDFVSKGFKPGRPRNP